ncbi:MAG: HAD family hydrolase [Clostridiales bacterium]|nr:HAD family hydrolase [Clostridiales bacterium]
MLTISPVPSEILVCPFEERHIVCAFHDIDGTHSLIRDWPPVMSIVLHYAETSGVPEGYDSAENVKKLAAMAGKEPLPVTDAFCVESAGLSALTQMEWALRRAVDAGTVRIPCDPAWNREKIERITGGEEVFPNLPDSPELEAFLAEHTPRLFVFYEKVLNAFCRDRNLALAKEDPGLFRIPGSPEFMEYLFSHGVKNYFVTGAVVEKGMGMHEEVVTLGYGIGHGKTVEDIIGSTWTEKLPKDVIMGRLAEKLGIPGEKILVVGDGRSEISAGVNMGALCVSRLSEQAEYQRGLHRRLGTHIIVSDFTDSRLYAMFS